MKPAFYICISLMMVACTAKKQDEPADQTADRPISSTVSTESTDTVRAVRKDTTSKQTADTSRGSIKLYPVKDSATVLATDNITAKFLKGSTATTISAILPEAPKQVTVFIKIKQGKRLSATIYTKDNEANIRINQLFTPDHKADGPFGKELTTPIVQQGMYKLIIGHDLMAEGGSAVKFQLRLVVK